MKKIFTTLAAAALVAISANAKIEVTYEGAPLENGAVITLKNSDFKFADYSAPGFEYYEWVAECNPEIRSSSDIHYYLKSTVSSIQFCPRAIGAGQGNCFMPVQDGDFWVVDVDFDGSNSSANMHLSYNLKDLPDATETSEVTVTNKDGDKFTYTVVFKTETSGVDEIMASEANIAGIYDLQGRPVSEDFRGVAIVVYDNGKAVKQVIK